MTDGQRKELEKEFDAMRRVGADVAWADEWPLPLAIRGAVRIARQAQLHPLE